MTWGTYLQFALAFSFVLALIAVAALAARRFGLGHAPRRGGERRLTVSETAPLDARHKLVLIRRDSVEHLLVLGPNGPTLVEAGIRIGGTLAGPAPEPAPGSAKVPASTFATALAESWR